MSNKRYCPEHNCYYWSYNCPGCLKEERELSNESNTTVVCHDTYDKYLQKLDKLLEEIRALFN